MRLVINISSISCSMQHGLTLNRSNSSAINSSEGFWSSDTDNKNSTLCYPCSAASLLSKINVNVSNLCENTQLSKRSLNVKTDMKSTSNVSKRVLEHWLRNEPQTSAISAALWSMGKISVLLSSKHNVWWYLAINNNKTPILLWFLCWETDGETKKDALQLQIKRHVHLHALFIKRNDRLQIYW